MMARGTRPRGALVLRCGQKHDGTDRGGRRKAGGISCLAPDGGDQRDPLNVVAQLKNPSSSSFTDS